MKKVYNELYIIKAFAIISVICAHCNAVGDDVGRIAVISSVLMQNLGTVGVGCFFIVSGFLFHCQKGQAGSFFCKRITRIIIPWLFSSTLVYLYVHLRKPPLDFVSWLNFVLGNGSYCYYLTVLMGLYLIFALLPFMRSKAALIVCECTSVISLVAFPQIGRLSPYLNILNWIGYFALGVHLNQYNEKIKVLYKKFANLRYVLYVAYITFLAVQICLGRPGKYWEGMNVIGCFLGICSVISLSISLGRHKINRFQSGLIYVGKESFFIYIWHMPIAGIMARITLNGFLANFAILRPAIVLCVVLAACYILTKALEKMRANGLKPLLGIRG